MEVTSIESLESPKSNANSVAGGLIKDNKAKLNVPKGGDGLGANRKFSTKVKTNNPITDDKNKTDILPLNAYTKLSR
jgi:hypothetical protein